MDQHSQNQRRRYYRLHYPEAERPTVWFKGLQYEVAEVSEGGLMILLGDGCAVRLGQSFVGVVVWYGSRMVRPIPSWGLC